MEKNTQTPDTKSDKAACSSYRDSLIKSIKKAHRNILDTIDYESIRDHTGRDIADLEAEASEYLGRFLNNYPNTVATSGSGWHIRLMRQGHGTHLVEMSYPLTQSSGLIFNLEKINEAARHGLIDEDGEPVFDPPCCPTCLRKND